MDVNPIVIEWVYLGMRSLKMKHILNNMMLDLDRYRRFFPFSDIYEPPMNEKSVLPLSYRRSIITRSLLRSRINLPMFPMTYSGTNFKLSDLKLGTSQHSLLQHSLLNNKDSLMNQSLPLHAKVLQPQPLKVHLDQFLDNIIELRFRFLPGHPSYQNHAFLQTERLKENLTRLCQSLKLSSNSLPFSVPGLFTYSRRGNGLRSLVNENYEKVLVEVLTYKNGMYGRFLLLVSLGVSCTVWYILAPGTHEIAPSSDVFPNILSLEPFFNVDTHNDKMTKVCFLESKYLTGEVLSALENEYPFNVIDIPAQSQVRIAVGLGVMVAVFLAMGIVPSTSTLNQL